MKSRSRKYKGIAVAQGLAVGKAKVVDVTHFPSQAPRYRINLQDVEGELGRLRKACATAHDELNQLADKVEAQLGRREADLIRPQALMVDDPGFTTEVEELIIEQRLNVEAAVAQVIGRFEKLIASLEDRYLRERSADVRDAGRRILGHLLFVDGEIAPRLAEPCVVVSEHLVPSLTVHLDRDKILGLATERGGFTSHAAILARSLGIPAVTGLEGITDEVVDGETIIVDGMKGIAIVGPAPSWLGRYRKLARQYGTDREAVIAHAREPSRTKDGVRIMVHANVGRPEEVALAVDYGADGVGPYRTEFEYLSGPALPSEDMLAEHYGAAAEAFGDKGVVLRVLDIGGDKFPPSIPLAHEENPFIGLRGLRLILQHVEDLLLPQLRAIIRAGARGKVSVIYPMVSSVEDLEAVQRLFRRAAAQVADAGHEVGKSVRQGIMIEVPSCIPLLPELLERSQFTSVGTNDLVQYLLAADRNSERMVDAYDPFHPAVLRILETICRISAQKKTHISVCGEIASDCFFLPLLLGLGYRTVSVNVGAIPYVKDTVRRLAVRDCEALASEALRAATGRAIRSAAESFFEGLG